MSDSIVLLDVNIPMYAAGQPHRIAHRPKHVPAGQEQEEVEAGQRHEGELGGLLVCPFGALIFGLTSPASDGTEKEKHDE